MRLPAENYYQIYTDPGVMFERGWFFPVNYYLEVYVKTCGPSHILLTSSAYDSDKSGNYYEFIIGYENADSGQQETHIYRNGNLAVRACA